MDKKLRADTQRTRDRLLDAAGRLIEERGLDFSLPDLAREAGVSTATVYRHFDALIELRRQFYERAVSRLLVELDALAENSAGFRLYYAVCARVVEHYETWARPASVVRSSRGYLERLNEGDGAIAEHYALFERVLTNLIELGIVPDQNRPTALLLWATVFDERVYLDFRFGQGLSIDDTCRTMSHSVLAILRSPPMHGLLPHDLADEW